MKRKMLSVLLAAVLALSLVPGRAFASTIVASGECGAEGDGSNLKWALDSNGTLTISGTGDMADYEAGENYGGEVFSTAPWHPNTEEGEEMVRSIRKVVVEPGVTGIGSGAFAGLYFLEDIDLPNTLKEIRGQALMDCFIYSEDGVTVTIPEGAEKLGDYLFFGSPVDVVVPSTVTSIEAPLCARSIEVAGNNPSFTVVDGVLFSKDMSVLVEYLAADGEEYTIPASVTAIGPSAFFMYSPGEWTPDGNGNASLRAGKITVPEGVVTIGDYAFSCDPFCSPTMSEIYLPGTLKSIGNGVLLYQSELTDIYYNGTKEMWDRISIGEEENEALSVDKIHFSGLSGGGKNDPSVVRHPGKVVLSSNLDLTDVTYWYVDGDPITKHNKNAVGGQHFSMIVNGPDQVCGVWIWTWMDEIPSEDDAKKEAQWAISTWKEDGETAPQQYVPFMDGGCRPVREEDLNKTQYVLFVGVDKNIDLVGYDVVETNIGEESSGTISGMMTDSTTNEMLVWDYTLDSEENKDVITVTSHDITDSQLILVAIYDAQGKMLSVHQVFNSGDSVYVTSGDIARIFWINASDGTPKADRAEIKLAAP